jgi:plasmid stability protein
MPNLSIKDVPEQWAEALRQRAARNHRSLQGELMAILERAATAELSAPEQDGPPASQVARGKPALQRGSTTIEQIFGEHVARFPKPIEGARAVDLIREDRDAR